MNELISVIVGFYNREDYVISSIESLLKQSYTNIEIVAFDDNSTDQTYKKLVDIKDERLKLIRHSINVGFTKGLVNAIKKSSGQYIAIHGAGDISYGSRLEKQYQLLKSQEELGVVGCNVLNVAQIHNGEEKKYIRCCDADTVTKQNLLVREKNAFQHGEVMMKRKYYELVGGYRPAFYYSQDRDLWIRLIQVCKFGYVDEVLYECPHIPNSVKLDPTKKTIQKKYSELARQCGEKSSAEKGDLVDQYGLHGIAFLRKSKRLSDFYLQMFKSYLHKDRDLSLLFLELAAKEHWNFQASVNKTVIRLFGFDSYFLLLKFSSINAMKRRIKLLLKSFSMEANSKNS